MHDFVACLALILAAAAFRLFPHLPNWTPLAAMALFGGARLGRPALSLGVVLGAMLLSDLILGFDVTSPVVYLCLAGTVGIGLAAGRKASPVWIAGGSLAGSVLFFVVTNFGVWALQGMYPKTLSGLAMCYTAAIPFFGLTAAGDIFFAALLFGCFELLRSRAQADSAASALS